MCLISYGPLPPEEVCRKAAKSNAHGIGIAWVTKKGVEWEKGLDIDDLFKFPDWIKKFCSVHFRLSTAGAITDGLNHPFPIEEGVGLRLQGRAKAILMHNGHVTGWEDKAKEMGLNVRKDKATQDAWSDSRWLASLIHRFGSPDVMNLIVGQRILYLTNKEIKLYGDWVKDVDDEKVERWYSNYSFRNIGKWDKTKEWAKGKGWVQTETEAVDDEDWLTTYRSYGGYISKSETWQERQVREARDRWEKNKEVAAEIKSVKDEIAKETKSEVKFLPGATDKRVKYKNKKTGAYYHGSMEAGYLEDEHFIYRRNPNGSGWDRFPKLSSIDKNLTAGKDVEVVEEFHVADQEPEPHEKPMGTLVPIGSLTEAIAKKEQDKANERIAEAADALKKSEEVTH